MEIIDKNNGNVHFFFTSKDQTIPSQYLTNITNWMQALDRDGIENIKIYFKNDSYKAEQSHESMCEEMKDFMKKIYTEAGFDENKKEEFFNRVIFYNFDQWFEETSKKLPSSNEVKDSEDKHHLTKELLNGVIKANFNDKKVAPALRVNVIKFINGIMQKGLTLDLGKIYSEDISNAISEEACRANEMLKMNDFAIEEMRVLYVLSVCEEKCYSIENLTHENQDIKKIICSTYSYQNDGEKEVERIIKYMKKIKTLNGISFVNFQRKKILFSNTIIQEFSDNFNKLNNDVKQHFPNLSKLRESIVKKQDMQRYIFENCVDRINIGFTYNFNNNLEKKHNIYFDKKYYEILIYNKFINEAVTDKEHCDLFQNFFKKCGCDIKEISMNSIDHDKYNKERKNNADQINDLMSCFELDETKKNSIAKLCIARENEQNTLYKKHEREKKTDEKENQNLVQPDPFDAEPDTLDIGSDEIHEFEEKLENKMQNKLFKPKSKSDLDIKAHKPRIEKPCRFLNNLNKNNSLN